MQRLIRPPARPNVRATVAIRNSRVRLWIRLRRRLTESYLPDAESRLRAVENERDDQVLLIVEMSGQQAEQGTALDGIAFGRAAQSIIVDGRAQERIGRLHRRVDLVVDHIMIVFQHIEAVGEARLGRLKHGEIMEILDLVMSVKLL